MKKRKFASLLLLAPLALCAACGGGLRRVEFQTNWYRNTSLGDAIADTIEELEYAVTMSENTPRDGFSATYTDGSYKMYLKNDSVTLDASTREGYVLTSSFQIAVEFSLNGVSTGVMYDSVDTSVEFLPVGDNLKPVHSRKEVISHTPNESPADIAYAYTEYHYSYDVEYDDALTVAKVTYTNLLTNEATGETYEPVTQEYDIEGEGTYLDNEEILFAMRGVNFSSASTFRTFNSTMGRVLEVSLREAGKDVTESVSFERNGEQFATEELPAYEVRLGYEGNIGQGRKIVFAKKSSDTNNENRNVPLRIESPIVRSLGTLCYTLKKAVFTEK